MNDNILRESEENVDPVRPDARKRPFVGAGIFAIVLGCTRDRGEAPTKDGPLLVFNAGSLAGPFHAVLDSFSGVSGVGVAQENSGSVEAARKLTELHEIPDVLGVSD